MLAVIKKCREYHANRVAIEVAHAFSAPEPPRGA